MINDREKFKLWVSIALLLAILSAPYLFAFEGSSTEVQFGGFLLNPIDGNSYLAKMRQGFEGDWLFRLPYTAQPGEGAPINLYYLFLGHLSRWLDLPLLLVFHVARLIGATFLFSAIFRLSKFLFSQKRSRWFAFWLASLGSGLGWIAIFFGYFSADFWVAEGYPFLAAYANAHFPLGLALQIELFHQIMNGGEKRKSFWISLVSGSILLTLIYPFGYPIVVASAFVWLTINVKSSASREAMMRLKAVAIPGGLIALYQYWIVNNHPVLSQWDAQNITPSPSPFEMLVSFSPALIIALVGLKGALESKNRPFQLLVGWLTVSVLLMYMPLGLQRRLISGLYVPVAMLAVSGVERLAANLKRANAMLVALIFLSLPSNLIVLAGGIQASAGQDPSIFIAKSDVAAFEWLDSEAQKYSLILASPESGNLIPAYSSMRVIYGHPFETMEAPRWEQLSLDFYSNSKGYETETLDELGVDFLFYGPRERLLGKMPPLDDWGIVYEKEETQIWARSP